MQDRERGLQSALPRGSGLDEPFSDRVRDLEERFSRKSSTSANKKPKDLIRAIGKIESNDWNVKEIEKKIEQSKKIHDIGKSREKVPKWDKTQFMARQSKMAQPEKKDGMDEKYKDIDSTLKAIDKQLKEGHNLETGERGKNKVASLAGTFGKKEDTPENQNQQKQAVSS